METKVKKIKIIHRPPSLPCIWFQVPSSEALNDFSALEEENLDGYTLELKKRRNKSLTANAYMWQLCEKIAKKTGVTKDDIYRKAVRDVGVFTEGVFRSEDIENIERTWGKGHIGWFVERYDNINSPMAAVRLYHGSSLYDGEQMRRLVDYVVSEAKDLKIDTMTPAEIERLKQLWSESGT